jgi:hypothetical protein
VQRLIEQPVDEGEVQERGTRLGRVNYHLSVYQRFSDDERPGAAHFEVEGHITSLEELDLADLSRRRAELTLHLADGRVLDFSVVDRGGAIRSTARGLYTP